MRPKPRKYFKSRAEKILSLVSQQDLPSTSDAVTLDQHQTNHILIPRPGADSEDEREEDELTNEQLEILVNDLFDVVPTDFPDIDDLPNEAIGAAPCDEIGTESQILIAPNDYTIETESPIPTAGTIGTESQKKKRKELKKKKQNYKWRRGDLNCGGVTLPSDLRVSQTYHLNRPLDYFFQFFSEELVNVVVEQTRLYALQKTGMPFNFSPNDFYDFLAIELLMGIVHMPAYRDYWGRELRYNKIADIMPVNRYEKIRKYLHFNDNNFINNDPFYKVRPILDIVQNNCKKIDINEKKFAIDEAMVPYKGTKAGKLRQYIRDKPNKWGFKFFVRSGTSGLVYDFLPYSGTSTFSNINFTEKENNFSFTEKCVVALVQSIPDPQLCAVYFDNFYSSPRLMLYLRNELGVFSLGTLRANRSAGADKVLMSDKELTKKGRGAFDCVVDKSKKLSVTKWVDTKVVMIASTYVGTTNTGKLSRWSKEAKAKVPIECPQAILEYNSFMGGVDLSDMLCSLYRTPLRTHKYYSALFGWLLDIACVNAFLLYKLDNPEDASSLKHFKTTLADELMLLRRAPKRGRPSSSSSPPSAKRVKVNPQRVGILKDGVGHFPVYKTRGKCRYCHTGLTNVFCEKYELRFCLNINRNCFTPAHKD